MKAHFFDLDTILIVDSKVWIIDKSNPSNPLVKISPSDFNLIKKGIWKDKGERFYFNGVNYWIPEELANSIKVRCKKLKVDITNLGFSLQEFNNSEVIGDLNYDLNLDLFTPIKNTVDHIYFICSKNNKRNYELIIKKIEDKLHDIGLEVKDIYYISETFMNRDEDDILFKKMRLLLQHSLGYKTEGDKFISSDIDEYDSILYYDDDIHNIDIQINDFLKYLLDNTEETLRKSISSKLKSDKRVCINYVSPNKVNRIQSKDILLNYGKIIKTFEGFKWNKPL